MQTYDLFKKLPDGSPMWVSAEDDLTDAITKMKQMAAKTGMEHFVYNVSEQTVVATSTT